MPKRKAGTIFFAFLILSVGKCSSISTDNNINLEKTLFSENFEGGIQNWILEDGWSIEILDNNTVLKGTGHRWAKIKNGTWNNYSLGARFKAVQGNR